jgi:membrane protein involved in colicin uptake
MNPAFDIIAWTGGIVAVLGALAKVIQALTQGRISGRETEQGRIAAQWKRLEDMNDDLRADNERYRRLLAERDAENIHLRQSRDAAWEQVNRRRQKREGGGGG